MREYNINDKVYVFTNHGLSRAFINSVNKSATTGESLYRVKFIQVKGPFKARTSKHLYKSSQVFKTYLGALLHELVKPLKALLKLK